MGQLFSWVVNILLVVWAVIIANKNGKNPWLWGILTFLLGLLPLGILHVQVGKKGLGITLIVLWSLLIIFILVAAIVMLPYLAHHGA